jgi:hypothetical protein
MTGEGNEGAELHLEKEEQSTRDEEAPQEKEDSTPVKATDSKEKRKGESKSEPADDDSDKNNIDDDVPLSFPQRVSCCMRGFICETNAFL